jgi:alpha,alpha-trehalase
MSEVTKYIKKNWDNSVHQPTEQSRGIVKMPKPYSVPCANIKDVFSDFYYWDTYFANLGFILDEKAEQAENNLDVMAHFINNLGYMPNANHLLDRSQPPLFTRGVMDLYAYKQDKKLLEKYLPSILREYEFFALDRMTEIGLNAFGTNSTRSVLKEQYIWLSQRVGEYREREEEQIDLGRDFLSIAESGWDFNPRFHTDERRFAVREFAHLDLNCLLYDVEKKISEIMRLLDAPEKGALWEQKAAERKELINGYMLNLENGIYYDYNFKKKVFSNVVSCASLYPYAMGVSTDCVGAKKVLERLELAFGLAACEYRGEKEEYLQWDYPSMWPSNVYFAYNALKNVRLIEDAKRIAQKYMETVERCYAETGALWEKYDASIGKVSVTREYDTPEMMGWTAGVYRYLEEELKNV